MHLEKLGYSEELEVIRVENGWQNFDVGRVISEHKDRYIVRNKNGDFDSEVLGNLRFTAESRLDFPAVGDWLAILPYDEGKAIIHGIFSRYSVLKRKAVGQKGKVQLIAANIDFGLIIQAVDRDFNLNRLERYLTICHDAKINPIIVLSKTDLIDSSALLLIEKQVMNRIPGHQLIKVNNRFQNGYIEIERLIENGKTYCLLGSSGVGKSTLLNHLQGRAVMNTGSISDSVNKGKHTTTHRELFVLESGGIIIDNPGMRELGIADGTAGLDETFHLIHDYAKSCKYSDCKHINENSCAVLKALDSGELDEDSYLNYLKLEKEKAHFEASNLDRRKKDKAMGKLYKSVMKHKHSTKF